MGLMRLRDTPGRRRSPSHPFLPPDDQQPSGNDQEAAGEKLADRGFAEEQPAEDEGERDAEIVEGGEVARLAIRQSTPEPPRAPMVTIHRKSMPDATGVRPPVARVSAIAPAAAATLE